MITFIVVLIILFIMGQYYEVNKIIHRSYGVEWDVLIFELTFTMAFIVLMYIKFVKPMIKTGGGKEG